MLLHKETALQCSLFQEKKPDLQQCFFYDQRSTHQGTEPASGWMHFHCNGIDNQLTT